MNRLPLIDLRIPVCIICEGAEEYDYLSRLKALNVWNDIYKVDLVNANGIGSIPAHYQDKYQNGKYHLVLAFCDTDKRPYIKYSEVKAKINSFHGTDEASSNVVLFGNPCTMQIIIEHFDEVLLKSPAKGSNACIIASLTGINDYDAKEEQRSTLMSLINKSNYNMMLKRIKRLSSDDQVINSTNFDLYMDYLSSSDSNWIDYINSIIEV